MSLKQIIRRGQVLRSGVADLEIVIPEEPLIYSIKYNIGNRSHSIDVFRNQKWKSILKSILTGYYKTSTPLVLLVRFYVSPPSSVVVKESVLKSEKMPAVFAYELCDYLLSFLEMLHHTLINSYRQFVKIDVEKFYSNNPRTVFKFMKWDHYVNLQNNNSVHSKSQGISEDRQIWPLQS